VESRINGEKATILLLDTEGLASLDESQTHDAKVSLQKIKKRFSP
jgi:hypothetical protein